MPNSVQTQIECTSEVSTEVETQQIKTFSMPNHDLKLIGKSQFDDLKQKKYWQTKARNFLSKAISFNS